jgi:hypothetical protein
VNITNLIRKNLENPIYFRNMTIINQYKHIVLDLPMVFPEM